MTCRNSISICALRLIRCNADGSPVAGSPTGSWALVAGIGKLQWTPQIQTGDDISELDGCGNLAVSKKYEDRVKRADVEVEFLTTSPQLYELLYGANLLTVADEVVGYADLTDVACGEALTKAGVIVEGWGEAWNCDEPAEFAYERHVFPRCFLTPGQRVLQRGVNRFTASGFCQPNSNFADTFGDLTGITVPPRTYHFEVDTDDLPTADADCGYVATPS